MIVGTAYFVSKSKAVRYYYSQGYGEAAFIVKRKLADNDIHSKRSSIPVKDIGMVYMIANEAK